MTEQKNIYQCLADINAKVVPIKKEKTNQQQNFKYRGIDQVMNDLHALFAEYGIIVTSSIENTIREERVSSKGGLLIYSIIDYRFKLSAPDGSNIETTVRGEAMDSGDKSSNKCYSIALKYALLGMFLIPTDEMKDPDAETHEVAANQPEQNKTVPQQQATAPTFNKTIKKGAIDILRGTFPTTRNNNTYKTPLDYYNALCKYYDISEADKAELIAIINQPK